MPDFAKFLAAFLDPRTWQGALLYAVLLLVAAAVTARLVRVFARRILAREENRHVDRTAALFLVQFIQVVIYVLAILSFLHIVPSLQKLGTALLAGVSVVSVVFGLAAQTTLSNFIAGISLLLYRPFRVDDVLQITTPSGAESGIVERITLGYTMLRTMDGRCIIVPNATMATQVTLGLNHARLRVLAIIPVGVTDRSKVDAVRRFLFEAAGRHPDVISTAGCPQDEMSGGGVALSLRVWCATSDAAVKVQNDIAGQVSEAFKGRDVLVLPRPQQPRAKAA